MSTPPEARRGRWWIAEFAAAGILVVAAVSGAVLLAGRARVTGGTAAERVESICRLADERPRGAAAAVADAAAGESDPAVRRAAYLALRRFPSARVRPVIEAGTRDPRAALRAAAAATLGEYRDPAAAERLAQLAREDADADVRLQAVRALEHIGSPGACRALLGVVDDLDRVLARRPELTGLRLRAFEAALHLLQEHWPRGRAPWERQRWNELRHELDRLAGPASKPTVHDGAPVPKEVPP